MVDDKPIMELVHLYENLKVDVLSEGMNMCEILQANVLLKKFPPSLSEYRNQLKHKKKDLILQELINRMRTEEANRLKDKQNSYAKANLIVASDFSARETSKKGPKGQNQWDRKKQNRISKGGNKIDIIRHAGHKAHQCYKCHGQQKAYEKPGGKAANHMNIAETIDIIVTVVVEANIAENKVN